jgi:AhpD family alkylhydroperoxidase
MRDTPQIAAEVLTQLGYANGSAHVHKGSNLGRHRSDHDDYDALLASGVTPLDQTPTASAAPRIAPGTASQIGRVNFAIARLLGALSGGPPPNLFTTLALHRRLFRRWLRFASALMPGGLLHRAESELVILRVAHNCRCDYERAHHERLGKLAGLTAEELLRIPDGPAAPGWSDRQRLHLRAADELHATRTISAELWAALADHHTHAELIELCMLVGHYEMLAMTLNAIAVQPDRLSPAGPPRALRALQALQQRRARDARRSVS